MKSITTSRVAATLFLCMALAGSLLAQGPAAGPLKGMVDQYLTNLKKYKAIMLDVGTQDGLAATNRQLNENLQKLGLANLSFTAPPRR